MPVLFTYGFQALMVNRKLDICSLFLMKFPIIPRRLSSDTPFPCREGGRGVRSTSTL